MLTSFTQFFWQRYIQLTHESLQRSLSISTASFIYIVALNPADQNSSIDFLLMHSVSGHLHKQVTDLNSDICLTSFAEA
ncbi:hypothetical protein [Nostoc sp.]|uniref:hypothetical protein n=1 Tax=Nostoc sp. TaxID=1180 RepID=UPI002FF89D05